MRIGTKFTRLTTISEIFRKPQGKSVRIYVKAECECGVIKDYATYHLLSGATKSCGCYGKEQILKSHTTHGLSNSAIHRVWLAMKQRCYNKSHKSYKDYGGRGISICDEWLNDFKAFCDWAIANGWRKKLQIDRYPNQDGNYEPSNCRVVTAKINSQNKRTTKLVLHQALSIRNLHKIGAFTTNELADIYQVSRSNIKNIIGNYIWV